MKKINLSFIIFATLLLLITPLVSAEISQGAIYSFDDSTNIHVTLIDMNKGFSVSSPYSGFEICSCNVMTNTIQIANTGSYASQYTLSSNKDYVVFSQNNIDLLPGEFKEVLVYINAPCSQKQKDTLEISVTSVYGDTKTLQQQLSFKTCQNLVVGLHNQTITNNVCEPFTSGILINNLGSFDETYTVDVLSYKENAILSSSAITIPAGTSANTYVYYTLPCDVYGDQELNYIVKAQKTGLQAMLTQKVIIPQEYPFTLSGPQTISSCAQEDLTFPIYLINENDFAETYEIKITAPNFVSVEYPSVNDKPSKTITLLSQEELSIPITITETSKNKAGQYNITVDVLSTSGDIIKTLTIDTTVVHCYEISSHNYFYKDTLNRCGGDIESHLFTIKNQGEMQTPVGFVLYAPDFVSLNQTSTFVNANGEVDVEILYSIPEINQSQSYKIAIETYRAGKLEDTNWFTLNIQPTNVCDSLSLSPLNQKKHISKDSFSFNIKNNGLRYGEYDIYIKNSTPYLSLEESKIALGKKQQEKINLLVNNEFLNMAINASSTPITHDLVHNIEFVFINQDSGVIITENVEVTLALNHPWYVSSYNWFKEQSLCRQTAMTLLVLTLVFLTLTIIRCAQKRTFSSRKILGIVLLALILLSTGAVLLTQGAPTRDKFYTVYDLETNTTRYLLLEEDRPRTFDLTNFFADPDNDIINYTVLEHNESVLSYDVNAQEHTIKLSPLADWSGTTSVFLSATDAYNCTAFSGEIVIDVLPVEDYSAIEFFDLACVYINWSLLTLLVLFIWLSFSFRKKQKKTLNASQEITKKTIKVNSKKATKKSPAKTSSKKALKKSSKTSSKK